MIWRTPSSSLAPPDRWAGCWSSSGISTRGSRHFWPSGSQRSSSDDSVTRPSSASASRGLLGLPGGLVGPGVQVDVRLVRGDADVIAEADAQLLDQFLRHARAVTEDQAYPP